MRTTQIHCNRCGETILGGHSILEFKAGELTNRVDEPYIDLCGSCVDRFLDFIGSGRQNGLPTVGTAPVGTVRGIGHDHGR